jgi:hypothetical protein
LDAGCICGGICKLRELIEEHPAELAFDFRERFHLSIFDVGISVTWKEAILLISVLMRDTSSWTQAMHSNWKYPVSREWIVAAHNYELLAAVNSKRKPKPYPNPFPNKDVTKTGKTTLSFEEVRAVLDRMNPKET